MFRDRPATLYNKQTTDITCNYFNEPLTRLTKICCPYHKVPTPPGKSWKNIVENYPFFIGSNGKQAEIVNVPVCVDFYLLK